ncbi:MAG: hypothetical protein ACTSO7_08870 [Candidatus Heimdallarchaeota archaeon]
MLIDIITGNPEEVLTKKLDSSLKELVDGNSNVLPNIISQIKAISDYNIRLYALLFIYELEEIETTIKKKIFSEFLFDTNTNIQFHMILFAGIYYNEESLSSLQKIKYNSNDLILSTTIWSLAKLGQHDGLTDMIANQLSTLDDDRALTLLVAALYIICNDKNSQEILLLRDYFLKNFYDEKKQCLFDEVAQSIDFSPEFIGYLLWQSGYKYVTLKAWKLLELDWLISNM